MTDETEHVYFRRRPMSPAVYVGERDSTTGAIRWTDSDVPLYREAAAMASTMTTMGHTALTDWRGHHVLVPCAQAATESALTRLPIMTSAWDGDEAQQRLAEWAGINTNENDTEAWDRYASNFLYRDADADPHTRAAYKLPVVDIVSGERQLSARAVQAVRAALAGARGGVDIPDSEAARVGRLADALSAYISEQTNGDGG